MKVSDRVWRSLNRKARGRLWSYFYIILPWTSVGVLGLLSLIGLGSPRPWLGILFGIMTVVLGLTYFLMDRRQGYIDAIYSNYLNRRKTKLKELGEDEGQ